MTQPVVNNQPPFPPLQQRQSLKSRIFYSTQSGRAKACARRTARIINDAIRSKSGREEHPVVQLQNRHGTTFDDALLECSTKIYQNNNELQTPTTMTTSTSPTLPTSIMERFVHSMKQSGTTLLLCFISTAGDGEHTDSIQHFWKLLLQKSLSNKLFHGISIAIFSLGDRCYGPDKYCAAGRKLMIRLRQLGATLLVPAGYGDDNTPNGGIFTDLDDWLYNTLLPHLFPAIESNVQENASAFDSKDCSVANSNVTPTNALYEVTIVSLNRIDTGTCSPMIEEWQQERYSTSYKEFFGRQSPANAYRYAVDRNHMISRSTNFDNGSSMLLGHVVENRRLSATDWEQNTRHIRLDVSTSTESSEANMGCTSTGSRKCNDNKPIQALHEKRRWSLDKLPYQAGDVAVIMPSNTVQEVNDFLTVLPKHIQEVADCELNIECIGTTNISVVIPGNGYMHWPAKCTFRGLLTYCGDIHALPEREDLRALAHYCSDHLNGKQQHDKLTSLSETKESALYVDYIIREKRSWVDVLYDFDSLRNEGSKLTIEAIVGLLLPIRPRLFSIASSPTADWIARNETSSVRDEFSVELCVAVVEGTTRRGRRFHGLCSNYIEGLTSTGSEVPMKSVRLWIQPGSFHGLPLNFEKAMAAASEENTDESAMITPVLCIGAGTGIAPLRAMLHEREAVWQLNNCMTSSIIPKQPNMLLFGCRKKAADFYYEQEWKQLEHSGQLQLLTAFSQDQWHKIYVQQVLESEKIGHAKIVKHLVDHKGAIYIAGGPKMARAVNDVIVEALCKFVNQSDAKAARKALSKIQNLGLYSVEAW